MKNKKGIIGIFIGIVAVLIVIVVLFSLSKPNEKTATHSHTVSFPAVENDSESNQEVP